METYNSHQNSMNEKSVSEEQQPIEIKMADKHDASDVNGATDAYEWNKDSDRLGHRYRD
ncbi:MAG: hypothetical protein JST70_13790 [Bacteroidetes bacterium]|nr:hypothetical protein [Bacteroidota bacterium]